MAKETFVQLTDDIDGGEAVEELTFALRGVEYEIDLSAKNVAALEKALERYIDAGHRVASNRGVRSSVKRSNGSAPKEDLAAIREWARASGYEISSRGRIPAEIKSAYDSAE
jgi:hypothetical protein